MPGGQGGPGAQWAPFRTDRAGRRDLTPLENLGGIPIKSPSRGGKGSIANPAMGPGGGYNFKAGVSSKA